ncbi:glycosyltransferase family 2 protein [Enterobacter hormaechei]|uniref:glycosyltransferase family 2 protein n=1 Tax=Enterobacter hormaechei TaxID=158836 RepID=UPI001867321E|nr:glycosyltransferase [Enterobacter hormaechei]MDK3077762.1 glycosyltransferase [Enterobacter hormaechei]
MFNEKQALIQKTWQDSEIKVSICCITYNHEKYIATAIESFLSQQTNFAFEILIGEDKGTDNTLTIINEYRDKFPGIVKVITSDKNLGANGNIRNVISHAQGCYIAFCEGDDYWIDPNKIQKQYDAMILSPDVNFCFHPAYAIHPDGSKVKRFDKGDLVRRFSVEDVLNTNGQFSPTSSYMFKKEVVASLPAWFENAPVGDLFIELYAMKDADGLYLPSPMSVYRLFAENSWSSAIKKDFIKNIETQKNIIKYTEKSIQDFERYKEIYDLRFSRIYCDLATKFLIRKDYRSFNNYLEKSYFCHPYSSAKQKMYLKLKGFPVFLHYLHKLKSLLNK